VRVKIPCCPQFLLDKIKKSDTMCIMDKPLQAILIATEEMRDDVFNQSKKITIREGLRDYQLGRCILCCHLLNWAQMVNIVSVTHKKAKDVTQKELEDDKYKNHEDMLKNMLRWYPKFSLESDVTVARWEFL
jgi:hypothetical protein